MSDKQTDRQKCRKHVTHGKHRHANADTRKTLRQNCTQQLQNCRNATQPTQTMHLATQLLQKHKCTHNTCRIAESRSCKRNETKNKTNKQTYAHTMSNVVSPKQQHKSQHKKRKTPNRARKINKMSHTRQQMCAHNPLGKTHHVTKLNNLLNRNWSKHVFWVCARS